MKKGCIAVRVTKLNEVYCGKPTGNVVFHTEESGCASGIIPNGCPLGRGATEDESLRDFCFRANADNPGLNLTVSRLVVSAREDRVGHPVSGVCTRIFTGDM
jgi:hypothetical protein